MIVYLIIEQSNKNIREWKNKIQKFEDLKLCQLGGKKREALFFGGGGVEGRQRVILAIHYLFIYNKEFFFKSRRN